MTWFELQRNDPKYTTVAKYINYVNYSRYATICYSYNVVTTIIWVYYNMFVIQVRVSRYDASKLRELFDPNYYNMWSKLLLAYSFYMLQVTTSMPRWCMDNDLWQNDNNLTKIDM